MVGKPRISASNWHQAIEIWCILQAVRISVTDPDRLLNSSWHCVLLVLVFFFVFVFSFSRWANDNNILWGANKPLCIPLYSTSLTVDDKRKRMIEPIKYLSMAFVVHHNLWFTKIYQRDQRYSNKNYWKRLRLMDSNPSYIFCFLLAGTVFGSYLQAGVILGLDLQNFAVFG